MAPTVTGPWLPDFVAQWYDEFAPTHATPLVESWRHVQSRVVHDWAGRLGQAPNRLAADLDHWIQTATYATRDERVYRALQAADIAIRRAGIAFVHEYDSSEWRAIRTHWRISGNLLRDRHGLLLPQRRLPHAWVLPRYWPYDHAHGHFEAFLRWTDVNAPGLQVESYVLPNLLGPVEVLRDVVRIAVVPLIASVHDFSWEPLDLPSGSARFRVSLLAPDEASAAAVRALEAAAESRADVVVFPELCLTPAGQKSVAGALPSLTRSSGGYPWLVVASTAHIHADTGDDHHNRAVVLNGDGKTVFEYNKLHRYEMSAAEQDRYGLPIALGSVPRVEDITTHPRRFCIVETPIGRVAVAICEDVSNLPFFLPLMHGLAVDWLLVPVLDGVQTESRWTARRAKAYAEFGVSVVVATSASLVDAHLADLARESKSPQRGVGLIARPDGSLRLFVADGTHDQPIIRSLDRSRE